MPYPESRCFPSAPHSEDSPACCQSASCKWSGGHACGLFGCCPHGLQKSHTQICKSEIQWFIRNTHEFFYWRYDSTNRPSKHTLTLCDGKDQIPLLQEFPVQPWRSKEEVCDRSQTCPANSWLDVLLQAGTKIQYRFKITVRAINRVLKEIHK